MATGQSFPAKPLRLVIGFTPGGGVDINARLLAAKLTELLGQQVIVENKPGAGTNIANEYVAKSAPDGYTLLFNSSAFAINLALYQNPPYALRDFAAVSAFSESTNLLVVSASLPARSLQEVLALAGAKRTALMPEVPTMKEAGVEGVEVPLWFGLLAPAATPREIVQTLSAAVAQAANSPDLRKRLLEQGADPVGNTPEEFDRQLHEEVARWMVVVKISGVRAD